MIFGHLAELKVDKIMFTLIIACAIKLRSTHSKFFIIKIGTVLTFKDYN